MIALPARTFPLLLALQAVLLLSAGPVAGQARPNGAPELLEIAFEGNEVFPDDSLAVAIENRETSCRTAVFLPLCWAGAGFAIDRRYLRPRAVPADAVRLELYYWQRGYREARVDTALTRLPQDEVRLTFQLEEGRPVLVDTIMITGDSLPVESITRGLPLRKGAPLNEILVQATQDTLEARLRNSGYGHAAVFRDVFVPDDSYEAEVEFDVFTGPRVRFGEIDVQWGNPDPALSEETVRRFLPFRTGDLYSREEILQAQRQLFGVEIIQSARVEDALDPEAMDTVAPVNVTVNEGQVHRVRTGAGWSLADCVNAEARWTSRNFFGGARRLTLLGRVSNILAEQAGVVCEEAGDAEYDDLNWLLSAELFQPFVFSSRNSARASIFAERSSLPDVFVRQAYGLELSFTRLLAPRVPLTLSFRPTRSTLTAAEIFFCTSFLVCAPEDIDVLEQERWLSPADLDLTVSRTDNVLNPTDGWQVLLGLEHASGLTGSNYQYDRVVAEGNLYFRLARRTGFAFRLRGGWVGNGEFSSADLDEPVDVIHPQKRLFAGGANSVRGFAQNRLGPRVLTTDVARLLGWTDRDGERVRVCTPDDFLETVCDPSVLDDADFEPRPTGGARALEANAEYRFAVGQSFQAVLFLDAGQVWEDGEPLDLADLELSPGVGMRFFTPVGPVRLDLGYRLRGREPLRVVTSGIRPVRGDENPICVEGPSPDASDPTCGQGRVPIDFVRTDDLVLLDDPFVFGEDAGFSLRRLQLHLSIGQAF